MKLKKALKPLALLLAISLLVVGIPFMAQSGRIVFEDPALEAYVCNVLDPSGTLLDTPGEIDDTADALLLAGLTNLILAGNFTSLGGLEYLPFLAALDVSGATVDDFDKSMLPPGLTNLDVSGMGLAELDVSGLSSLVWLDCSDNQLRSLNIAGTALNHLDCSDNLLLSLDMDGLDPAYFNYDGNFFVVGSITNWPGDAAFNIAGQNTFIEATDITFAWDPPPSAFPVPAGETVTLLATVAPTTASFAHLAEFTVDPGTTSAYVDDCYYNDDGTWTVVIEARSAGTGANGALVKAKIPGGGVAGADADGQWPITFAYEPVTDIEIFDWDEFEGVATGYISGDPAGKLTLGKPHTLDARMLPVGASTAELNLDNIVWSMVAAGTTGAMIDAAGNITFGATGTAGTITVRATAVNGAGIGMPFTKDFDIVVEYIPITQVSLDGINIATAGGAAVPGGAYVVTQAKELEPNLWPLDASYTNIVWTIEGSPIGAGITGGNVLTVGTAYMGSTITVVATIANGVTYGADAVYKFVLTAEYYPVAYIEFYDTSGFTGADISLPATAYSGLFYDPFPGPEEEPIPPSFTDIDWFPVTVPAGAVYTLVDGVLNATTPGDYYFRAVIEDGKATGIAFNSAADNGSYPPTLKVTVISNDPTDITDLPDSASPGVPIPWGGTVVPDTAAYDRIDWTFVSSVPAGLTPTMTGREFLATQAGVYTIRADVMSAANVSLYNRNFTITVENVGVLSLNFVPTGAGPGVGLDLSGVRVSPANATNQTIVWEVTGRTGLTAPNVGATLTMTWNGTGWDPVPPASLFTATLAAGFSSGSYVLTPKIAGGNADGTTWNAAGTTTFTINVASIGVTTIAMDPIQPVSGYPLVAGGAPLVLSAVILPGNAVNRTVTWTFFDAGMNPTTALGFVAGYPQAVNYGASDAPLTGLKGYDLQLRATAPGRYYIVATIIDGRVVSGGGFANYTQNWVVDVTNNPVTSITITTDHTPNPLSIHSGDTVICEATVLPTTATALVVGNLVKWSIANPGTTGATIDENTGALAVLQAGFVEVRASLAGGMANGSTFSTTRLIEVRNVAVTGITGVSMVSTAPTEATAKVALTLPALADAAGATNRTISRWEVTSNNGTGSAAAWNGTNWIFTANTRGTLGGIVTIKATIPRGSETGTDVTFDCYIEVLNVPVTAVTPAPAPFVIRVGETLSLRGDVAPLDATNKTIVWSLEDAGTTGGRVPTGTATFIATAPGTAYVTATIAGGQARGGAFVSPALSIPVTVLPIAVSDITGVQTTAYTGDIQQLKVSPPIRIAPTTASFTAANITWTCTVSPAGAGDPIVGGNTFQADMPGTYTIKAAIPGGLGDGTATPFEKPFTIDVVNRGVQNITCPHATIRTGMTDLAVGTLVAPANASFTNITWSIVDAGLTGATISGSELTVTSEGQVKVLATIEKGRADGADYTKEFIINVSDNTIIGISGVIATAIAGTPTPLSTTINPPEIVKEVIWSVLDPAHDVTGSTVVNNVLNALRPGTVTLKATIVGGNADGTDWVRFYDVVITGTTVNPGDPTGGTGQTVILSGVTVNVRKTVSVRRTGDSVQYASSSTKTASVDASGTVLGKRTGNATITILADGYTYQVPVKVTYNFWQWLLVIFLFGWIWLPLK